MKLTQREVDGLRERAKSEGAWKIEIDATGISLHFTCSANVPGLLVVQELLS